MFRHRGIVGGDDDGCGSSLERLQQCVHSLPGNQLIQLSSWLVSQDQPGFQRDCPRHRHALRLSSGQFVWNLVCDDCQIKRLQRRHRSSARRRDVPGY